MYAGNQVDYAIFVATHEVKQFVARLDKGNTHTPHEFVVDKRLNKILVCKKVRLSDSDVAHHALRFHTSEKWHKVGMFQRIAAADRKFRPCRKRVEKRQRQVAVPSVGR